ncbi:MAG: hypothetical protein A2176_08790 [Spirochaetes bacterium RBG_13_51_14]|nr:MAG: hypothetical protein A2176_08790 [Spirochaetes bacterium RBG_13_51_14]
MNKKILLTAVLINIFLLYGCSEVGSFKFVPFSLNKTEVVGAKLLQSVDDLPTCDRNTEGYLYYILDPAPAHFEYCGSDRDYHPIDLTGPTGQNGAGINWLGDFSTAPSSPNINDAYYDTTLNQARIYTSTGWEILANDGANGAGINWRGEFSSAPSSPSINDAYYDTTLHQARIYTITGWQILSKDGISIVWLGALPDYPVSPSLNNAFYHTGEGIAYIWDGSAWQILCQDGQDAETPSNVITWFAFLYEDNPGVLSEDVTGLINGADITLYVPDSTVVTGLVASFTTNGEYVIIGTVIQSSGVTANDFTNTAVSPIIYSVIAADGLVRNYVVRVNISAP